MADFSQICRILPAMQDELPGFQSIRKSNEKVTEDLIEEARRVSWSLWPTLGP